MNDVLPFPPYREPLHQTLTRTLAIALVIGAALAQWPISGAPRAGAGFPSRWGIATLLALWPSLGGHFVEIVFLNVLRPRLPAARASQVAARIATWFIGGALLTLAMKLTATTLPNNGAIGRLPNLPTARLCLIGGLAFIPIELTAHLALLLRRRPSIYDGRG
jgi:hypothetical protein